MKSIKNRKIIDYYIIKRILFIYIVFVNSINIFANNKVDNNSQLLNNVYRINTFYMDKFSDYTRLSESSERSSTNIWTRGLYFDGILSFYDITKDDEIFQFAEDWSIYNNWKICKNKSFIRSIYSCSKVYLKLNKIDEDIEKVENLFAVIDTLNYSRIKNKIVDINSFFFIIPIYLELYDLNNSERYENIIIDSYLYFRESKSYDKKINLWISSGYTKYRFFRKNKRQYQLLDNAMLLCSLSEFLNKFPDKKKNDIINKDFQSNLNAILKHFKNEGWNDDRIKQDCDLVSYSLICYSICNGIKTGILDNQYYIDFINQYSEKIISECINEDGSIKYINKDLSFFSDCKETSNNNYDDAYIGLILKTLTEIIKVHNNEPL